VLSVEQLLAHSGQYCWHSGPSKIAPDQQELHQKIKGSKVAGKGNTKSKGKGKQGSGSGANERYRDLPDEEERIGDGDNGDDPEEVRRWEMEEQQVSDARNAHVLAIICLVYQVSGRLSWMIALGWAVSARDVPYLPRCRFA
jgi:hypothetical protein